ncbi:hypothetical protein LTR37_009447 [Vermiconidia calcicola]|uniref:Uncharacterized protein n=1 Tax=Vermiconidia calcicola TaxID=1690605 RepID=A0ACC3N8W0_9PEZI|nr:hypothetical protein LTR37_009447 [Vermiconidia calcicola]
MASTTPPLQLLDCYDIIIAGGGTAGCVLAARLTEDADRNLSVLLLEAGPNANSDFRVSTPGLFTLAIDNPELDWQFVSEPSEGLNGRKVAFPRGKCLGGSSAINLMALIYPSKAGLDAWEELGNPGWGWEGLAPYYRKSQRHFPPPKDVEEALALDYIDPKVQGTNGPICSSYPQSLNPLEKAWVDTWKGLQKAITGVPLTGVGTGGYTTPASVDPVRGERSHAGSAYLAPALHRPNLHVLTGMVDKIEVDDRGGGEGLVATAVTFTHEGKAYTAHAGREVIVSAGTIGSPVLLERSGIGSKALCEALGIKNYVDNSNVGENLQDHVMCGISYEVQDGVATADMFRDPTVIQKAMEQYQASRSGPLAGGGGYNFAYTPLTDFVDPQQPKEELKALLDRHIPPSSDPKFRAGKLHYAFNRSIIESPSEASASLCMIQVQFNGHKERAKETFCILEPENYITLVPQFAHPFSPGSVHIQSKDAVVHPKIEANYLSHPLDAEILGRHMQQVETIASSPPLADFLKPSGRRLPDSQDAHTLARAIELVRHSATSNYHPSGTCAMMPAELGGVVNERLVVHGTKNLRVCDASVFPLMPRGNIQSTVYAVAEKGADLIREDLAKRLDVKREM